METKDIELGALTEKEKLLIFAIRHRYRYGKIRIITRNGQPFRLEIAERFEDLEENELSTFKSDLQS